MVRIYASLKPITQTDIAAFEEWAEIKLPESYKQFLLETNGGFCQPSCFKFYFPRYEIYEWGDVGRLLGISDPEDTRSLHKWVQKGTSDIPLALGHGGNMLILGVAGEDKGKVYYWIHDTFEGDQDTFFVANDFAEFLAMLQDCPEDDE